MRKNLKKYYPVFVLPTTASFFIAFVFPFLAGIALSFTKFTTVTNAKWVGLQNYIKAFSNEDFVNALWFTVKFPLSPTITWKRISVPAS